MPKKLLADLVHTQSVDATESRCVRDFTALLYRMDFSLEWTQLTTNGGGLLAKIVMAVICGGIIGYERESTGKSAGLRTCLLVSIGSTVFTIVSFRMADMFGGDATRIAAQIVTGIGFLGAGVIMREFGRGITGLTTAAMIWVMAGIGMLIGSGMLITALILSLLIMVLILTLGKLERRLHMRRAPEFRLVIEPDERTAIDRVKSLMAIYSDDVNNLRMSEENGTGTHTTVSFEFIGDNNERNDFLKMLYEIRGVNITNVD